MPRFDVKMFAYLKDRHGECVSVEAEPSVNGVYRALSHIGIDASGCRLSVNLSFPIGDEELQEGDELALIPPVSGG
ncbi:MAG TPA: MoaD/ThiS family protein [Fimbriimonadaceae bacterium]|nr:MoaD/ThiS family protein [Fimbriimonadaceae bacterium]